mmetsp:Transcript_43184/g.101524  ORF Transcript_43184/g.101524 Transcript_43184/m.101524 type:complete len:713 (-) Transcript_43184:54-2192(-)
MLRPMQATFSTGSTATFQPQACTKHAQTAAPSSRALFTTNAAPAQVSTSLASSQPLSSVSGSRAYPSSAPPSRPVMTRVASSGGTAGVAAGKTVSTPASKSGLPAFCSAPAMTSTIPTPTRQTAVAAPPAPTAPTSLGRQPLLTKTTHLGVSSQQSREQAATAAQVSAVPRRAVQPRAGGSSQLPGARYVVHRETAHQTAAASSPLLPPTQAASCSSAARVEVAVVKTVKHQCPDCGEVFPSAEDVKEHWLQLHWKPTQPSADQESVQDLDSSKLLEGSRQLNASDAEAGVETRTVVKHLCPTCNAEFESLNEVRDHWLSEHAQSQASAEGDDAVKVVSSGESKDAVQLISCDDSGRAKVLRQMDDDGSKYTVVMNDDGTKEVYTESVVTSMACKEEDDVTQWMNDMTDLQLRGFVHEATERVVEGSQKYHARREELQKLGDKLNFAYFGLDTDATEKQLEVKYRQLAKRMHPDKNGGTDSAKEKFQNMKRRYEQLRERIREGAAPAGQSKDSQNGDGEEAGCTPKEEDGEKGGSPASDKAIDDVLEWEDLEGNRIGFKCDGKRLYLIGFQTCDNEDDGEPAHIVELRLDDDEHGSSSFSVVDSRGSQHRNCLPAEHREVLESLWLRCQRAAQEQDQREKRQEAYDEDEDPKTSEEDDAQDVLSCDYSRRDSMEKMAWRMIRQLKSIRTNMDILDMEFRRFESSLPVSATSA